MKRLFLLLTIALLTVPYAQAQVSKADSIYNAGNEAYRLKHYGQAVLCYSRTLWMDPGHDDARYNLSLVQTQHADQYAVPQEMFFTTWVRNIRTVHSVGTWQNWSIVLFALLLISIVAFRQTKKPLARRLIFYTGLACMAMFCTTNVFAIMQQYDYTHNQDAVVMADEAPCYDSPVAKSKPATILHAGTTVTMTERYTGGWVEVILPDTRHFWTKESTISPVASIEK